MKEYSVRKVKAINDQKILTQIAQEDDHPYVRRAARDRLKRVKKYEKV